MKGQAGAAVAILLLIVVGLVVWGVYTGMVEIPGFKPPVVKKWKGLVMHLDYPVKIGSGQEGELIINLTNDGDSDATLVNATLWGLSDKWRAKIILDEKEGEWFKFKEKSKILVGDIKSGEYKTVGWRLEAPEVKEEQEYPFEVEVEYGYSSTFKALIKVVSKEYYEETGETGGIISQSTSDGPLKMEITPIEFVDGKKVKVNITINNVGGGEIKNDKLKVEGVKGIKCDTKMVTFENEATYVVCDLELPKGIERYRNIEVSVKAPYYVYVISEEGKIKVSPVVSEEEKPPEEMPLRPPG
jgi:hypothetical protein